MRDPKYITPWSDKLTVRVHIEEEEQRSSTTTTTTSTRPKPEASNTDKPSRQLPRDTCQVMKSSSRSLAIIRNLPPSALILLLTPILPPAKGKSQSEGEKMDPFEPFGREIAKSHKRVRHVPYVPKIGWTETHEAWLSQAAAVVVVTCQPSPDQEQNAEQQVQFVSAVADARWEKLPKPQAVPYILMQFNGEVVPDGHDEYENELHADVFTTSSAAHAAGLLFKASAA